MGNFALGFVAGTAIGVGIIMTVHPMNKRSMRKAYRRAGRFINRINDTMHEWCC